MDRTGLIKYFLKVNNVPEEIISIQIDNGRKSQRLLRIVHDLEFDGINIYIFFDMLICGLQLLQVLKTSAENLRINFSSHNFIAEHIFLTQIRVHFSQFQGLCSMKSSREMLQNLSYFWNKKTQILGFFHFSFQATLDLL